LELVVLLAAFSGMHCGIHGDGDVANTYLANLLIKCNLPTFPSRHLKFGIISLLSFALELTQDKHSRQFDRHVVGPNWTRTGSDGPISLYARDLPPEARWGRPSRVSTTSTVGPPSIPHAPHKTYTSATFVPAYVSPSTCPKLKRQH
jgi:hypothetical protein